MIRSALGKVAWVGRTASMVFGLALVMALVLGVASMAFGANGQNFILGKFNNAATKVTGLVGNVDGAAALRVTNPNSGTNDTALDLRVQAGEAPMKVNSNTRVANLNAATAGRAESAASADNATNADNANTLDSRDSSDFASSTHNHDERYFTETESDSRFVDGTEHTKAVHDSLGIDAETLDGLDSTALQRRVGGSCAPGSAVRAIGSDGSVTCEPDDFGTGQVSADNIAPLPAARARSSNLGVANTTFAPLVLDFEDFDQVGAGQTSFSEMHPSATNKFTAPRAGIYEVQAEVIWAGSSATATGTGQREIRLLKNTTTCGSGSFYDMDVQYADPTERTTNRVSTLVELGAGGSVILCGYQASGESLNASFVFADMHYVSGK